MTLETKKPDVGCGFVFFVLALWPFSTWLRAQVCQQIYLWYLASIPGFLTLKPTHFIGLSLLISMFGSLPKSDDTRDISERVSSLLLSAFFFPLFVLAMAWFGLQIFVR